MPALPSLRSCSLATVWVESTSSSSSHPYPPWRGDFIRSPLTNTANAEPLSAAREVGDRRDTSPACGGGWEGAEERERQGRVGEREKSILPKVLSGLQATGICNESFELHMERDRWRRMGQRSDR